MKLAVVLDYYEAIETYSRIHLMSGISVTGVAITSLILSDNVQPMTVQAATYTRNEWGRCKTTLETGGEDAKLHSKRVEKIKP